jgi:hypothetical protein
LFEKQELRGNWWSEEAVKKKSFRRIIGAHWIFFNHHINKVHTNQSDWRTWGFRSEKFVGRKAFTAQHKVNVAIYCSFTHSLAVFGVYHRVVPDIDIEFFVETTGPTWRMQGQKTWPSICLIPC